MIFLDFLDPIYRRIACNSTLKASAEKATLTSPGYPLKYENVGENGCFWEIEAEKRDGRVAINFQDFEVGSKLSTLSF